MIGIDEISIRKGHVYRMVVSDLEAGRPIWFGGVDRSETSLAMCYAELGLARAGQIRLAVMDMWKASRNATEAHAPHAAILYDKFHVVRQLNDAMDKVRKAEYKRITDRADRKFIKGQKYALLSHRANLAAEKRRALQMLLAANKRLNTAFILKEQSYPALGLPPRSMGAKVFDQWRRSLRWQRFGPIERLADLVERHRGGIAASCQPEKKVTLGIVEGLNNKVRVIQRRC